MKYKSSNFLYFFGFLLSFSGFALQFFIPKVSQFLYSFYQLPLLVSLTVCGLGTGFLIGRLGLKNKRLGMEWAGLLVLAFILHFGFFNSEVLLYLFSFLIFLLLGFNLIRCLYWSDTYKFYFFDLLGGVLGIVFAYFSLKWIAVETSIVLISFILIASSLFSTKGFQRKIAFLFLIGSSYALFLQTTTDRFNLMLWTQEINHPKQREGSEHRNGKFSINNHNSALLFSRWSSFDRTDIIEHWKDSVVAYANNTQWTGIPVAKVPEPFPYLRLLPSLGNLLSIGTGGGYDLYQAEVLDIDDYLGLELNEGLVSLLQGPLYGRVSKKYDPNKLIATDARLYLQDHQKKYDVILSQYADTNFFSERYFTKVNLLRSADFVSSVLEHLSSDGVAIWTLIHHDSDFDPLLGSIYQGIFQTYSSSSTLRLQDHLVVLRDLREKDREVYHLVISPSADRLKPLHSNEFLNSSFKFQMVFPSTDASDLPFVNKIFALNNYGGSLAEGKVPKRFQDIRPRTLSRPVHLTDQSRRSMLSNLSLVFLSIAIFLIFSFASSRSHADFRASTAFVAMGFLYGVSQALLLQEVEIFLLNVSAAYAVIMFLFLLAGAFAALVASTLSARTTWFAYCLYPTLLLGWAIFPVAHSPLVLSLCTLGLFIVLLLTSLAFPKLIALQRNIDERQLSNHFALNLISISAGALCFYLVFAFDGRNAGYKLFILSLLIVLPTVLVFSFLSKERE